MSVCDEFGFVCPRLAKRLISADSAAHGALRPALSSCPLSASHTFRRERPGEVCSDARRAFDISTLARAADTYKPRGAFGSAAAPSGALRPLCSIERTAHITGRGSVELDHRAT